MHNNNWLHVSLSEIQTEREMQKSQNFCQNLKADRKLILAIFLIAISVLNVFVRASWGFYAETPRSELEVQNSQSIENRTDDNFLANQETEQKLHFTTQPVQTR